MAPSEPFAQLRSAPKTPRRQWVCHPRESSPGGIPWRVCDGSISTARRFCSLVSSPSYLLNAGGAMARHEEQMRCMRGRRDGVGLHAREALHARDGVMALHAREA